MGCLELRMRQSGVQLHCGIISHMDPGVDVWRAPEVPDKRGPLQSPDVPHAIVAQIALLVKGQRTPFQPALDLEAALRDRDPTADTVRSAYEARSPSGPFDRPRAH